MYRFNDVFVGPRRVTITALAPDDARGKGFTSWSLASLQNQKNVLRNPLALALSHELHELGVWHAFAPNVTAMSGAILATSGLTTAIRLGRTTLWRNKDVPADGLVLRTNEAFIMSAAGCPIVLASGGGYFIVAAAGRDSLVDRGAVLGTPSRPHLSLIDTITREFFLRDVPVGAIVMVMMFALPESVFGHPFDHPKHGPYNKALRDFVEKHWPGCTSERDNSMFLSLERLFIAQAQAKGMKTISTICPLTELPHLAHTRDGQGPGRRNLIVVKLNS